MSGSAAKPLVECLAVVLAAARRLVRHEPLDDASGDAPGPIRPAYHARHTTAGGNVAPAPACQADQPANRQAGRPVTRAVRTAEPARARATSLPGAGRSSRSTSNSPLIAPTPLKPNSAG
jgi:hypothetical protein